MMNNPRLAANGVAWLAAGLLCLAAGCVPAASRIQVYAFADDAAKVERYAVRFDECWFLKDESHDQHIVARAVTPAESPDEHAIEETLAIHLYWRPKPAKTHDNPDQSDATIHYVVRSGRGLAIYAGTGFVYTLKRWPNPNLQVQIERAHWRLLAAVGDAPRTLAPARITGLLIAANDPPAVTSALHALRLALGEAGLLAADTGSHLWHRSTDR